MHPFIVGLNFAFQVTVEDALPCVARFSPLTVLAPTYVRRLVVLIAGCSSVTVHEQAVLCIGLLRRRRAVFSFGSRRQVFRGSVAVLLGTGSGLLFSPWRAFHVAGCDPVVVRPRRRSTMWMQFMMSTRDRGAGRRLCSVTLRRAGGSVALIGACRCFFARVCVRACCADRFGPRVPPST